MDKTQIAQIIDLLTDESFDLRKLAKEFAKQEPVMFLKIASSLYGSTVLPWHRFVIAHINRGEAVSAIKEIRTHTGYGLKEAKDVYDYVKDYMSSGPSGRSTLLPDHLVLAKTLLRAAGHD